MKFKSIYLVRKSRPVAMDLETFGIEGRSNNIAIAYPGADIKRLRLLESTVTVKKYVDFLNSVDYLEWRAFTKDGLLLELESHAEYGGVDSKCPAIRWETLSAADWETMPNWIRNLPEVEGQVVPPK